MRRARGYLLGAAAADAHFTLADIDIMLMTLARARAPAAAARRRLGLQKAYGKKSAVSRYAVISQSRSSVEAELLSTPADIVFPAAAVNQHCREMSPS